MHNFCNFCFLLLSDRKLSLLPPSFPSHSFLSCPPDPGRFSFSSWEDFLLPQQHRERRRVRSQYMFLDTKISQVTFWHIFLLHSELCSQSALRLRNNPPFPSFQSGLLSGFIVVFLSSPEAQDTTYTLRKHLLVQVHWQWTPSICLQQATVVHSSHFHGLSVVQSFGKCFEACVLEKVFQVREASVAALPMPSLPAPSPKKITRPFHRHEKQTNKHTNKQQ